MAKSIEDIIQQRIDEGIDAWRIQLQLYRDTPFEQVRNQIDVADHAIEEALAELQEIKRIKEEIQQAEIEKASASSGNGKAPVEAPELPDFGSDDDDDIDVEEGE